MRKIKSVFSNLHLYVLCALASVLLWGWIFTWVTDTTAEKKVTFFVDADCADQALNLELETQMPEGIQMIRGHALTYVVFDESALDEADFYLLSSSKIPEVIGALAALTLPEDSEAVPYIGEDGLVYGIKIYDAATGAGSAQSYIQYSAGEDYYLCFRADSLHLGEINGSADDAALQVARHLMRLQ